MSNKFVSEISLRVDTTNPGQFFASCGLLELAERLWNGAEGWFDGNKFYLRNATQDNSSDFGLDSLLEAIAKTDTQQIDFADDYSSPIYLSAPFNLRLDWWKDRNTGGERLKVWAGSMRGVRIARAMQNRFHDSAFFTDDLFNHGMVVYDPSEPDNKVEPFYFDARRGANAQALDVGFAPDAIQQLTSAAYPFVEFLCLVGLQRYRPMPTRNTRIFDYYTWNIPLDASIAVAAVCGLLPNAGKQGFRFENAFRTTQKKHKAFLPALPIG
jgi:CRISPR-associated protein Csb3